MSGTRSRPATGGKTRHGHARSKPRKTAPGEGASRSKGKPQRTGAKPGAVTDRVHLYGVHAVRAALENPRRHSNRLLATQNGLDRLGEARIDASVEVVEASRLTSLVGAEAVHQGLVLECRPLDVLDASELFHLADSSMVLVLDQLTDPHNVGAILRSAVAMGVDAVLTTARNSASETGVLAKSASGALDLVKIVHLRNLSKGLAEMNDMGFTTIGLDSEGPDVLERTLDAVPRAKICLVLGAEGKGLREKTRETCSALARLDMPGPIKSLNVSNAAALSLYLVRAALDKET